MGERWKLITTVSPHESATASSPLEDNCCHLNKKLEIGQFWSKSLSHAPRIVTSWSSKKQLFRFLMPDQAPYCSSISIVVVRVGGQHVRLDVGWYYFLAYSIRRCWSTTRLVVRKVRHSLFTQISSSVSTRQSGHMNRFHRWDGSVC